MIHFAIRNIFQNKIRLVISVGGVALAMILILSLDAVFTGVERQITAYINNSRADIFVSQKDVRNMHMAYSSLPRSVIKDVESIPGIENVTPILFLTNMIVVGEERNLAYIIGLPEDSVMGGPWKISNGTGELQKGETVINRIVANQTNVSIGDIVEILGNSFKVVGFSEETNSLVNSVAFISETDFNGLLRNPDTISFLLVKLKPGISTVETVALIETRLENVTAQSTADFAAQERRVVKDMSADVITLMNLVGFLIGLAVMALTIYTATLSRRSEYGVLKALGARNSHLYQAVVAQALISVILSFIVGVIITLLLSFFISKMDINLNLELSTTSLIKVSVASLIIAVFSAILPIKQIAGLNPATVFREK